MSKAGKNFLLEDEEQEEALWEEVPSKDNIEQDSLYDDLVDIWIDFRLYVEDEKLPWLDKKNAFANFAKLCGYKGN